MQELVLNPSTARRRAIPAVLQIAAAALLGLVMVYATGFSTSVNAHNAAHDGRHSHSFPCH